MRAFLGVFMKEKMDAIKNAALEMIEKAQTSQKEQKMRFSAAFLQELSKFLHRHMTDFYDVQSLTITVTSRGFFASLINFVPSTLVFPR